LCLSKYAAKFVRKYLQRYPQPCARLHEHVYLHLNSDLYLDLSNKLFTELNREKFEKSFLKSFQKSLAFTFGLLFAQKYRQLRGLSCLALCRQRLPFRQSLGRPLGRAHCGSNYTTATYRCDIPVANISFGRLSPQPSCLPLPYPALASGLRRLLRP
jgi:hypothetical protein